MCSGYIRDISVLERLGRERDLQLKIKDGELRLHDRNDGFEGRYSFLFTLDQVVQPNAQFDVASFEPVRETGRKCRTA
jgi:hypothetical protein